MRKTQRSRGDELAYLEEQSGLQPVVELAGHEMHEIIGTYVRKKGQTFRGLLDMLLIKP